MELMASIKSQLHPVAALGSRLRDAVDSVFQALWPGQAEPDNIDRLLLWMTLMSNQVDVWKESAARAAPNMPFPLCFHGTRASTRTS
jgi:hypothetical protein